MTYDWMAGLTLLGLLIILTISLKFLLFKIPAVEGMRESNREQDQPKKAMAKYPPIIKQNNQVGLVTNVIFFFGIAPFLVTLDPVSIWKILGDIVLILLIYDFFYYLMHRFLFHGQGYFRRIHALHHQARNPSYVDALYVHPLETCLGIVLFMASVAAPAFIFGPIHAVAAAVAFLIWQQILHATQGLNFHGSFLMNTS